MGHPALGPNDKCGSTWDRVSRHFLDTIGVPVVCGRGFTEQDRSSSQPVAIVNQAFAKRYFLNQDPIGKRSGIDYPQYSGAFEIVGVFADFDWPWLGHSRRALGWAFDGQPVLCWGRVRSAGSAHCNLGAWLLRNESRFSARAPRCFH